MAKIIQFSSIFLNLALGPKDSHGSLPGHWERNTNHLIFMFLSLGFYSRGVHSDPEFPLRHSWYGQKVSDAKSRDANVNDFVRVARLQNEIAPEKCLHRYENWFEKCEKGSKKRSETCPKALSPSRAASKQITGTFLKVFHRPKCAKTMFFFSLRGSAGVATLRFCDLGFERLYSFVSLVVNGQILL